MHSPMMEPTNATYGFCRDIFTILEDFKPTHIFCAFDLTGKSFRREVFPEYKMNRSKAPDDLQEQIPFVEEVITAFDIPVLKCEGFEADDVIATVTASASPTNIVTVVTSDKDCRQLLSDHVRLYNIRKKEFYTAESLKNDWGIAPEQCVDFQSLCGDSSDNIPGARGIGPKTATELLQKYGSLEGIYKNLFDIPGKRRDNLAESKHNVDLSKRLVTLRKDAPVEIPEAPYAGYNRDKVMAMFKRFGFDSLYAKLAPTPHKLALY